MLEFKGIKKSFDDKVIFTNLEFRLDYGECLAILGPNGAGKSTLINILLGLQKQDGGQIYLNGHILEKKDFIDIGCIPDKPILIEELTGYEFLCFHGLLFSLKRAEIEDRIISLTEFFFENSNDINKKIEYYSTGMRRRLEMCSVFLHNPRIIILDEPFLGLDPVFCKNLIDFFIHLRSKGKLIIISSHDLLYMSEISSKIMLLNQGQIAFFGENINFFTSPNSLLDSFFSYLNVENSVSQNKNFPEWI